MSEGQPEFESCAVCGRTILRGERVSAFVTADGERAGVCALCMDRAEAAGWLPAELAASASSGARRRGGGGLRLGERFGGLRIGERLAPYLERARGALTRPRHKPREDEHGPASQRPPRSPAEARTPPRPTPPKDPTRAAIEVFNGSHERRKIAGLIRSLGEPKVSVRAGSRPRGAALVTVAWELSWYQWEVGSAADGDSVRQVAKGSDISEIPDPEPRWNASAGKDGALALAGTGGEA